MTQSTISLDLLQRQVDKLQRENHNLLGRRTDHELAARSDMPTQTVHTSTMTDVTRYEIDAKLEAIEARMDGRVASIESKIDGFLSAQEERDKRLDEQSKTLNRELDRLGSIKANVWGAMVTTIVILVAIGALGLTAFQAGTAKPLIPVEAVQPSPPTTE